MALIPLDAKSFLEIIAPKEKLLFIFDYDGTLSPLIKDHDAAFITEDQAALINKLTEVENTKVAIVTGRSMKSLKSLIDTKISKDVLLYASHGAEIGVESDKAAYYDDLMKIKARFDDEDHIAFEDKPLSLTLHYKEHPDRGSLIKKLDEIALEYQEHFRVQRGHDVYEFLPKDINKGLAIRHLDNSHQGYFPMYFGDDLTDNFAFEIISEINGLAIQVGDRIKDSKAGYQIDMVEDTYELIQSYLNSLAQ